MKDLSPPHPHPKQHVCFYILQLKLHYLYAFFFTCVVLSSSIVEASVPITWYVRLDRVASRASYRHVVVVERCHQVADLSEVILNWWASRVRPRHLRHESSCKQQ